MKDTENVHAYVKEMSFYAALGGIKEVGKPPIVHIAIKDLPQVQSFPPACINSKEQEEVAAV